MTPTNVYIGIIAALQVIILLMLMFNTWRHNKQFAPFWRQFQNEITKRLHRPHEESARMDYLMSRLNTLTITPDERTEITAEATAIAQDPNKPIEDRQLAQCLLAAMPLVIREDAQQPGDHSIDEQ